MYLQKIIEMKDEQAEAFNQANKIYIDAQRMKNDQLRQNKMEEEKGQVVFGADQKNINLDQFIKGEYLMASPFGEIKVPSKVEFKVAAHKQEATCLAFNTLGDAFATGGADCLIKVWSSANGKEVQSLRGFNKAITDVSMSLDNEYLAGASTEHKAMIWRLKTMRTVHTFSGHKETINASKFSFVTKSLLTGSQDRTIKVWDLEKGTNTKTVRILNKAYIYT